MHELANIECRCVCRTASCKNFLDIIQWKPRTCCCSAMCFAVRKRSWICVFLIWWHSVNCYCPFCFIDREYIYMRFEVPCCGNYEDLCLLDCDTLYCSQNWLAFEGTFCFHPHSRTVLLIRKWKNQLPPKHRDISTRIHGVTWRNAVIFVIYSVFTLHLVIFCKWYLCMQGQY